MQSCVFEWNRLIETNIWICSEKEIKPSRLCYVALPLCLSLFWYMLSISLWLLYLCFNFFFYIFIILWSYFLSKSTFFFNYWVGHVFSFAQAAAAAQAGASVIQIFVGRLRVSIFLWSNNKYVQCWPFEFHLFSFRIGHAIIQVTLS